MDDLASRTAWLIETIKEDRDLDKGIIDIDLAKKLGTDKNTLARYRQQRGLPQGKFIQNLVSHYHINAQWLFTGEGEPFPGARAKYPEVCGPGQSYTIKNNENKPLPVSESTAPYAPTPEGAGTEDTRLYEDLVLTAKVLKSNTAYSQALHLNIRSFSQAVDTNDRCNKIESVLDCMRIDYDKKLEELAREVIILRRQLSGAEDTSSGAA